MTRHPQRFDVALLAQFETTLQPEDGPGPDGPKVTGFRDPKSGDRYEPEIAWRRYAGGNDRGEFLDESRTRSVGLIPMSHQRSGTGFSFISRAGTHLDTAELWRGLNVLLASCLRLRWTQRFRASNCDSRDAEAGN